MYEFSIARAARLTLALALIPAASAQSSLAEAQPEGGETLAIDASSPIQEARQDDGSLRSSGPVHPITAPNYSDDPYITTDIRGTYMNQQFPNNDLLEGGAARVYDFQGRYAVSESTQVMVSKLGSADLHLAGSAEFGATDIAIGLKHALLSDFEGRRHFAVGAGYEFGVGDEETLGDDDEFRLFATYAQGFDRMHFSGSVNYLIATGSEDDNGDSDRLSLHLHADYEVNEAFSPVVELNYYTVTGEGDPVTAFSGIDLANFGGNEDEDVLTVGIGGELRVIRDVKMRLAYESPLTDNEDLFGYRWTASAIWSF